MRKEFLYIPKDVCSREFHFVIEDNKIKSLEVIGGCMGNLKGISSLLKDMDIDEAISKLDGIICKGSRTRLTSCPDQISIALKKYKESID